MKMLTSHSLSHLAALLTLTALNVRAATPTITMQPVGGAVPCGSNFTLIVTAASSLPLAYQWRQNLAPLADATNSSLTRIAFAATTGDYTVIVSNSDGSVTSDVATVTFVDTNPPQITCPPNIIAAESPRDGSNAVVTFAAPAASDTCDTSLTVTCVPPSGTNFPVGLTIVTCEARDGSGNSNTCAFAIRVIPYRLIVTTTANAGPGSLRQALLDANDAPGENRVEFQLPGSVPYVLAVSSPLPAITSPVILDGWSQAGFSGTPIIELDGAGALGADGLVIHSASNVVRGLAMYNFATALRLASGGSSLVLSNYLGTDASGANAPGNRANGLFIGSRGNVVQGNVLSGNDSAGLQIAGADAVSNVVQGNIIGQTANRFFALGNQRDGVLICSNAAHNVIGGTTPGAANAIRFNAGNGIALNFDAGLGNTLRGNFIDINGALGIDLGADGPTPNDLSDTDVGPNGSQNFQYWPTPVPSRAPRRSMAH